MARAKCSALSWVGWAGVVRGGGSRRELRVGIGVGLRAKAVIVAEPEGLALWGS